MRSLMLWALWIAFITCDMVSYFHTPKEFRQSSGWYVIPGGGFLAYHDWKLTEDLKK